MEKYHPDDLAQAIDRVAFDDYNHFIDGVRRYQQYGSSRPSDEVPAVIWQDGTTKIYDYGMMDGSEKEYPLGRILLVPSLINRGYILDLNKKRSFARFLAQAGYRPLLVDWGYPGPDENDFSLENYITGRLVSALEYIAQQQGSPVAMVGYCMGGLLALAATQARQDLVKKLVLLATPWNFISGDFAQARLSWAFLPALPGILALYDNLPVDILQSLFALIDPFLVGAKFRRFNEMEQAGPQAQDFVLLEDWLNDGVPLTRNVAIDCLLGWYVENRPATGRWKIGGSIISPGKIKCPSLVVLPQKDRIVPPESAKALYQALDPTVRDLLEPSSGHIGMMVGSKAKDNTWKPVLNWLLTEK